LQYAGKYPIIYNNQEKEFTIRLGDLQDKNFREYIMCKVPKQQVKRRIKTETNFMLQLTKHANAMKPD